MHSRIFSPKIGFICGMRKSARHIPQCPPHIAAGRQKRHNGGQTNRIRQTSVPPKRRIPAFPAQFLACRHPSIGRNGLSERPNRPHRKTTCESPAVARRHHIRRHSGRRTTSTERRPNSLSPHDRNVQERPRPDRRTETSAPRSERPCDLGSEKPAQPPCENSLRLFPNRSRFSHLPGLNPFRRTLDFSGRTPSENTDRRSSPTQTGNLTDGPSERYDPVP